MKMIDMGRKYGVSERPPSSTKKGEEKYYPSLHLDGEVIKKLGVKSSDIGDETVICIKVRVSSLSKYKGSDPSVGLEIIEAAKADDAKPATDFAKALYS